MLNKEICFKCKEIFYEKIYKYQTKATKEIALENFNRTWNNKLMVCHMSYDKMFSPKYDESPSTCSYLLEQTIMKELKDVK